MKSAADVLRKIIYDGLEFFQKFYSMYPGYVMDNQDPDNMGRVKLKVPDVYGDDTYNYWALPRNTFSGPNYGSQITPQLGAFVWVEFRHGNPKFPVWSHGYFKKGDKPTNLTDTNKFWFKTPRGSSIVLDDTNTEITIELSNGDKCILNNSGVSLVTDKIFLGKDGTADEQAVMGQTLQAQLQKEKIRVDLLYAAISGATVTPNDGGAQLKATMMQILQPAQSPTQAPDYSNILSNKVKLDR